MADKIWPTGFIVFLLIIYGKFQKREFHSFFSKSFQRNLSLIHACSLFPARRVQGPMETPRPPHTPPQWCKNRSTYHMIMITNFITISFKMLKNSTINLACSPIFPMAMPKAMKNPIRPVGGITEHKRTNDKIRVFFLFVTIPCVTNLRGMKPHSHHWLSIKRQKYYVPHWKYLSPA